jgi:hypothetical protein
MFNDFIVKLCMLISDAFCVGLLLGLGNYTILHYVGIACCSIGAIGLCGSIIVEFEGKSKCQ